ncbi:MAG: MgtC/SapB family protein [Candidatus Magasanikbacteria bacterium]|nr:MgtC/SapB family protein [Candidatus Magasanikbacteria bacterium]
MNIEFIFLGQVLLAAVLGGLLGFQRERLGKPAGPRTYALVTAGSALFTILSIYGFGPNDTARVASNIVVGMGFLGAGLIFQRDGHIDNLTTAAGLWASAAVGMAVGTGHYILAVGGAVIMLILFAINDSKFRKQEK